jgi:DNA modification methylase
MSSVSLKAVSILHGNVLDVLPNIPDNYFDCVVTSPPYWGLRDYGVEGQIGLEPTLAEHLLTMVRVFSDVRRVLKPSGTCWVNYGDCYATTPNGRSAANTKSVGKDDRTFRDKPFSTIQGVLKPKDLCMVSNRLAIALQESGWYVRSEIIWHKPNPMPESVRDRPTSAHEKVWLLTKSPKYYYDADAIREEHSGASISRVKYLINSYAGRQTEQGERGAKISQGGSAKNIELNPLGANSRNVWSITTKPFKGAHFATMPPELAARCIKAGCPVGGEVLDPFGGAGTTGLVANQLQRNATLIELNTEYINLAQQRIEAAE